MSTILEESLSLPVSKESTYTRTRKWEVKVVASDRVDGNLKATVTKEGHLSKRRCILLERFVASGKVEKDQRELIVPILCKNEKSSQGGQ